MSSAKHNIEAFEGFEYQTSVPLDWKERSNPGAIIITGFGSFTVHSVGYVKSYGFLIQIQSLPHLKAIAAVNNETLKVWKIYIIDLIILYKDKCGTH